MKKMLAWMLGLTLALGAACAGAETAQGTFEDVAGLEWSFSSGAGAWSTDLRIQPDGSFSGEYHDSEMGETGEEYPDGTVYGCSFSGHMTRGEQADEYSWSVRVDSLETDGPEGESIDSGVRYVQTAPYGLSEGDEMVLYRPGTPLSRIPEDRVIWTHSQDAETAPEELDSWFLCCTGTDSGFVSLEMTGGMELANPWESMTAEELAEACGVGFAVPEGAEDAVYRYLPSEGLAEIQFTLKGAEYCARVQPADLKDGEIMNISGMYFAWDTEEPVQIGHCSGTLCSARTGSEERVEVCLWYDAAPGLMYCVSAYATDGTETDLPAMAESIFPAVQGDA